MELVESAEVFLAASGCGSLPDSACQSPLSTKGASADLVVSPGVLSQVVIDLQENLLK